jgi:hypothetical protein
MLPMKNESLCLYFRYFIKKRSQYICILILIFCLLAIPGLCKAASEDDVYDAMWNADASLFTTGYGIFLDKVKDGQRYGASIDVFNKAAGFAATYSSVTTKAFAKGDISGAGEEAMLAVLSEIAGWPSGQGLLEYVGLSTGVFQLALTAYSITRESYAQVESTKIARDLESFYGTIENDPVLKPRTGRKLGDKSDPIPVTRESVEYFFRKVLQDASWRKNLNLYVTQELEETFPEPSAWDWLSIAAFDGWKSAHVAEQAELFKDRQQIETWIAGLLRQLNNYARAVENEVILLQTLKKIEKASKKITPEFQRFVIGAEEAEKKLPEIDAYAKQVPQMIVQAKKNQDWDSLYDIRDKIGYYVRVYVRVLPDGGDIGKKKQATKAALKKSWNDVSKVIKDIPRTIQEDFTAQTSASQYKTSLSLMEISPDFISIDEVAMRLHSAKSSQDMEKEAVIIAEETEKKYKTFGEKYYKANPAGDQHPAYNSRRETIFRTLEDQRKTLEAQKDACNQYCHWASGANPCGADAGKSFERCINSASEALKRWEQTAGKPHEDLEAEKKNYDAKRELYAGNVQLQYKALVKATGRLVKEERAKYADTEKLKKEALDKLARLEQSIPVSYPDYPAYPPPVNYEKTPAGVKQLLNSLSNEKADGYLGLPKLKLPKWGERGDAVVYYLEGMERKISNERNNYDGISGRQSQAMEYISRLKKHLADREIYRQEIAEVKERIYALHLQSDPQAQALTDVEKRVAAMKDVEKLMLETETELNDKLIADNRKNLDSIGVDLLYLNNLLKRVRYWNEAVQVYSTPLYKFAEPVNAVMIHLYVATENNPEIRTFLAKSSEDRNPFDKAKANAAADALLKEMERTGVARWDPNGDTGLKAMLEKKAAEIRNYYLDIPDYAIVDGNVVVYASRIAKMASDVQAIPASSYGSNTYKEGLKNRTFQEKLRAALNNGTALATNLELKENASDQTVSVKLDNIKDLAASHPNQAIRIACADLAGAIEAHLKRYGEQVAQEAKQWEIDRAKAEEELKLQNECLAKGGNYSNGECKTVSGGAGVGTAGLPGKGGQSTGTGAPVKGQTAGPSAGSPVAGMTQKEERKENADTEGQMPADDRRKSLGGRKPTGQPGDRQNAKQPLSGQNRDVVDQDPSGRSQEKPGPMASLSPRLSEGMLAGENRSSTVRNLYDRFKEAYESKNASGVIYCLSDQWESYDGGTLSDLQRHLWRTFRIFDQIQFKIQNMQISKIGESKYRVNYDAVITSRILKRNLKREEKSSIQEEVTIDDSGRAKITKTLGGKFLYIQ